MTVYLGADHRGYKLKEKIKEWFSEWGVEFEDLGNRQFDPEDDFPDYARKVAEKIQKDGGQGILICGSGGMALAANKFKGIWAAEVWDEARADHAGEHDDTNVISLPADAISEEEAEKIIKAWLKAKPRSKTMPQKYQRRFEKIKKIEERNFK